MELREVDNGSGGTTLRFTGYASVTETPYEMTDWLGDYSEVIRRGSFSKTLAEGADVPFKLNHDGMTLARTKSGTMRLAEDSTGLHVEADLDPRNGQVADIRSAMDRGDLDEMSFAFRVTRQEWSPDWTQRDITEVNLNKGDVSIVNYGANPHTAGLTSLRSALTDGTLSRGRLEEMLRAAGYELAPEVDGMHAVDDAKRSEDLSLYEARLRALNL
jgi:HK97 family phage prohead protease